MSDISFDVSTLASNLKNTTVNEIYYNKIILKVYHRSYQLYKDQREIENSSVH